jgi:hippurate hydrolase
MPGFAAGSLHTRVGAVLASEDTFEIRITGRGGHAARPHMVVDPLVIGAQVVLALQGVVSRNLDPGQSAVLSCTQFETDGVRNAIPNEVVITGDTRSYSPAVQTLLESRIREISAGICAAHGAGCTVRYSHEFEPTVNTAAGVETAVDAARATVPADQVDGDTPPIMASEDFGAFLRQVPGCFTFIGNGILPDPGGTPLHSAGFDFNDDLLEVGARYYVEQVRRSLTPGTTR